MSHRLRAAGIVAGVILIDRITKLYIQHAFTPLDVVEVIPGFFNIIHVENPGIAFGMFASLPASWRRPALIFIPLAVMALIGYLLFRPQPAETRLAQTGLALVLGGAAGNLWDRALRGTVTDFLQFFLGSYEYPSFNAADTTICVGAGLLVLDMLRSRRRSSSI